MTDGGFFEINFNESEKIRIEVGKVNGKMFVLVRKESGNFYSESFTVFESAGTAEIDEAQLRDNVMELLVQKIADLAAGLIHIPDFLKGILV